MSTHHHDGPGALPQISLSPEDNILVELLKKGGVFENIKPNLLKAVTGMVGVSCPDCDCHDDLQTFHKHVFGQNGNGRRFHNLALNGGAIFLSPEMTVPGSVTRAEVYFEDIEFALEKKGLSFISLYGHTPCGMATKYGMSLLDVVNHLVLAKEAVREHFKKKVEKENVIAFCHVNYGIVDEASRLHKMRTYRINGRAWRDVGKNIQRHHM